jgi:hypothetical protein
MMKKRVSLAYAGAALLLTALACQNTSPSAPSGTSGSTAPDPTPTSSVTAPRSLAPAADAPIRNADQPVTLVIGNALLTRGSTPTYTFEVAADPAFATKAFTRNGVAQGSGGQTSLTIDRLGPGSDYYWHARAEGGGTVGPFSAPRKFTIGPAIVLAAPVPVGPLNGAVSSGWPSFTVNDSVKAGPVGAVVYRFEVATTAAFTTMVLTGTVAETPNQTTFTPPSGLGAPAVTNLFWRATAIDSVNSISSPPSAVQGFTYASPTRQSLLAAQEGLTLWPGVQPPGTTGHAVMGRNWDVQTKTSFNGVTFVSPPLEELQIFDLLDRGFDPEAAIAWMKSNGYPTMAAWYPSVGVIGFSYQYLAIVGGQWDMVDKVGA